MGEMGKAEGERDSNRIQRLQQSIDRMLSFLNHQLQAQEFLVSQFSVADIGFIPRLLVLRELGVDPSANRTNIDSWMKRMLDRPSIQNLQGVTVQLLAGV
jgi:glutathione S-transferase